MKTKDVITYALIAVFGLLGFLGKMQIDSMQMQDRVQWEKISKLESEINYLRGYRDGYKCRIPASRNLRWIW